MVGVECYEPGLCGFLLSNVTFALWNSECPCIIYKNAWIQYIRQKICEIGRLLVCAKEKDPHVTVKDLVCPCNFSKTVHAVKRVAGYDEIRNTYSRASLAVKLGHTLKKISMLVESTAKIEGDKKTVDEAHDFQKVYDAGWNEFISATARQT